MRNLQNDSDAGGGGGGDDDFPHLSCSLRYAKMSQRKEMGRRKGVTKAGHCHIFFSDFNLVVWQYSWKTAVGENCLL